MVAPQSPIRLFENRWLEKLTVIAVPTFMVLWAIGLAGVAWTAWGTSSAGFAVLLAVAALVMLTLTEYALHRFVFHWGPKSAVLRSFVFLIHRSEARSEEKGCVMSFISRGELFT